MDVTILGDVANDLFTYSSELPVVGETVIGSAFQSMLGGTGANQAIMASKLGAEVSLIATVGVDAFGSYCVGALKRAGIHTGAIRQSSTMNTGIGMIMVNERTGENQIVAVLGANSEVSTGDVNNAFDCGLFTSKLFSCQYESNATTSLYALERAHAEGVITLLNPAPGPTPDSDYYHLLPRFLAASTVISMNEIEASALTGVPIPTFHFDMPSEDIVEGTRPALLKLIQAGTQCPIITLGENGAVAILPTSKICRPLPPDVFMSKRGVPLDIAVFHTKTQTLQKVLDTTGSGDCFTGSLAYYMSKYEQLPMIEKIRRSVWIASRSVTRLGTQCSYPDKNELPPSLFYEVEDFKWSSIF